MWSKIVGNFNFRLLILPCQIEEDIIYISLCDGKTQKLSFIIDDDVEFEAVKPHHSGFFPVAATSLKTLFLLILLFLQTLTGVESTKDIPVPLPKQQVFAKKSLALKQIALIQQINYKRQYLENLFAYVFARKRCRNV